MANINQNFISDEDYICTVKLLDLIKTINDIDNIQELLEKVLDIVIEIMSADSGFIMLKDKKDNFNIEIARNKCKQNIQYDTALVNKDIIEKVINSREISYIIDTEKDDDYNFYSNICIPLISKLKDKKNVNLNGEQIIGIIYVDSKSQPKHYLQRSLNLIQILANYAAVAIEKIRLQYEIEITNKRFSETNRLLRKKIWDLASLFDTSKELSSSLNKDAIIRSLLLTSIGNMGVESGSVMLIDNETESYLVMSASTGILSEKISEVTFNVDGTFVNMLRENKPIIIDEILHKLDDIEREQVLSLECVLSLPIIKDNKLRGCLNLGKRIQGKSYDKDAIEMLSILVNQASVALENATLYEEIAKREKEAREFKIAHELQMSILPRESSKVKGTDETQSIITVSEQIYRSAIHEKGFGRLIGTSPAMMNLYELIAKCAPYDITVLIRGESGTGKELVAREIHSYSSRKDKPYITVNAATISKELFESEIFGHEKGSFTGAFAKKIGKLELANTGTFFIDEIGELSLDVQVKLLRVLQEKEFYRVGGTKPIKVDFRLLCATNRNLEQMVREGTFREDLYYRINIMSLKLPPLRERKEDIKLLAEYFLETSERDIGKPISKIEPDVMELFVEYVWPGNIREFFGVLQSAAVVCQTDCITKKDIPPYITTTEHIKNEMFTEVYKNIEEKTETTLHKTEHQQIPELTGWDAIYKNLVDVIDSTVKSGNIIYKDVLERIEKKMLDIVLEKTGRNLLWSSKLLGISRNRLKRTLEKYGIERKIDWKKYNSIE